MDLVLLVLVEEHGITKNQSHVRGEVASSAYSFAASFRSIVWRSMGSSRW